LDPRCCGPVRAWVCCHTLNTLQPLTDVGCPVPPPCVACRQYDRFEAQLRDITARDVAVAALPVHVRAVVVPCEALRRDCAGTDAGLPQNADNGYQLHPAETLIGDGGFATAKALAAAHLDKACCLVYGLLVVCVVCFLRMINHVSRSRWRTWLLPETLCTTCWSPSTPFTKNLRGNCLSGNLGLHMSSWLWR